MDIQRELKVLEREIGRKTNSLARDEGAIETLMSQLEEHDVDSPEDGEEKMIAIGEDINRIEDGIKDKLGKLRELYDY